MGREFYYANKGSGAKEGLERKQKFISQSVTRKENSMREFAIRRDSALFASVRVLRGETQEKLKEEYGYWVDFFTESYDTPIPHVETIDKDTGLPIVRAE